MRRQIPALGSLLVVAAVLCVLPFVLSDYNIYLAAQVGIFFIAVLGLNILTGYTGQISIGHGAFMAIGGYTTAVMSRDHHTNLVVTMLMAFAICFVVGLLVGLPALRLSGVYLALVDVRARGLGPADPAPVLELPRRQRRRPVVADRQQPLDLRRRLGLLGDPLRARVADPARARRARLPRGARQRDRSRGVRSRAAGLQDARLRDLGRLRGVAGSLFVLATNGFAQPSEFDVFLSLQLLVGAAVAGLGSLWGILVGAAFVGLLPQVSTSVPVIGARARPGRRLRRRGHSCHAPAPGRLRRSARADSVGLARA